MTISIKKVCETLSPSAHDTINEMKMSAESLFIYFNTVKSREMSLAITNLEQALMWATKAIALNDLLKKEGGCA